MLARVAERMYWLGRQIERAESTARFVSVYANLLLDLPRSTRLGWEALITLAGAEGAFFERHEHADERNVVRFLLADRRNHSSITTSCALARENARSTREILPREAWEEINELSLAVRDRAGDSVARRGRAGFLIDVERRCQLIAGILDGTMSHDAAYDFVILGRNLERADMTTRIVDVGTAEIAVDVADDLEAFENILWMAVLRSLSGYQMYRRYVRGRVAGEDVVGFLFGNDEFPRSVGHCLDALDACAARLPRGEACSRSLTGLRRRLLRADITALLESGLHEFVDDVQAALADSHEEIVTTWFSGNGSP
jgi:uncharacterized alpha-E superfamily protein